VRLHECIRPGTGNPAVWLTGRVGRVVPDLAGLHTAGEKRNGSGHHAIGPAYEYVGLVQARVTRGNLRQHSFNAVVFRLI